MCCVERHYISKMYKYTLQMTGNCNFLRNETSERNDEASLTTLCTITAHVSVLRRFPTERTGFVASCCYLDIWTSVFTLRWSTLLDQVNKYMALRESPEWAVFMQLLQHGWMLPREVESVIWSGKGWSAKFTGGGFIRGSVISGGLK